MQSLKHLTVLKKKGTKINENWLGEKRPTKLEIPNSDPLGGNMDGMGDLDNAPTPPMGADDMGMDNSMGEEPPMDNMGGEEPPMDNMGGEDPNVMGGPDDMGNGEDDELMSIINNLSIEDKAAVTKYAKSMADNSASDEDSMGGAPDMGGEMPMESRVNYKRIIDEVIEDMFDNKDGTKRDKKELPKAYHRESPFTNPKY